ncbi:uncharacterized protein LOC106710902 [Papilio machaon]|uniref:uncharacterized protein LOC106710902 n=1 Tax=Papilio machaon TaxID=76193 RepID=UPI001E663E93|nr:uncharacterized protein LOC106710902 [Papilio machaon]
MLVLWSANPSSIRVLTLLAAERRLDHCDGTFTSITGHFLIGRPLTSIPTKLITATRPNRYELIEKIRQHFWERWRREYISELQQRTKWRIGQQGLSCGDVVVLKEENLPPLQWRMGRVCRLYPGADGVSRVADVTTSRGIIRRAINKLCLLPTSESKDDNEPERAVSSTSSTS